MKKFMALILALAMLFALAACGQSAAPKTFTVRQCRIIKDGYIKVDKKDLEKLNGLE